MLRYLQNRRWAVVLPAVLLAAGCAVERPQPPVAPGPPPPVLPLPPAPTPGGGARPQTYTGTYPERIEAAARDALADTAVRVSRAGNTVKLIVPANAAFAINTAQLQTRFTAVLDRIANLCREYGETAIFVKGYTDSTGSFVHNQQLSEQRARMVGDYLGRSIPAARIQTAGYGPRYPLADNRTEAGRIRNKRVEIDMVATQ